MKKTIIYLGITFMAFSSLSFASNTNFISNQKALNIVTVSPAPLIVAISKGELETVKQFIESGVKVNKKLNGLTPLMYAARYNKVEIIKYLLQKGADRDIKDSQGFTALNYAELSNAYDAIAVLKSSSINEQVKISVIDDSTFLNPESVLFVKSSKTIDEIIAEEEKIIESTGFNEMQPLDFAEINKISVVKNKINSQHVVAIF
ncbi:MAG: ankyrin repeat domain-containing protein [Flavobacterium sp.]|nr:ankyrin repeat domain-containing protein [Flavobacterium sp.]